MAKHVGSKAEGATRRVSSSEGVEYEIGGDPVVRAMTTRSEGTTVDGISVVVVHHGHYRDDEVYIAGERVVVLRAGRYRDGGTTRYFTDRGSLTLPRRLNDPDRTPRWRPM